MSGYSPGSETVIPIVNNTNLYQIPVSVYIKIKRICQMSGEPCIDQELEYCKPNIGIIIETAKNIDAGLSPGSVRLIRHSP